MKLLYQRCCGLDVHKNTVVDKYPAGEAIKDIKKGLGLTTTESCAERCYVIGLSQQSRSTILDHWATLLAWTNEHHF